MLSALARQILELTTRLRENGIRHAAIGGVALNVHGYVRATQDIDFLIHADEAARVRTLMVADGFECLDFRDDLSTYVKGFERVDFLHARRPIAEGLLREAAVMSALPDVPVVSLEGLIGFKIQAFSDDPRRLKDIVDVKELIRVNRSRVDLEEVRRYFALFAKESLLDDILADLV